MKNSLTHEQIRELRFTHRHERDKKLADKIKGVLLLNKGMSYAVVAEILMLDEVTLRRYEKKCKEEGMVGLLECKYQGGKSRLSAAQLTSLEEHLITNTLTTASQIQKYIFTIYGKTYSLIGIPKLLYRMGFSYKKPKIVPGKASYALQKEFLQTYKEMKEKLGVKDHIYFSDATHPTHNTKPSYGWIKKGKKNDVYIKSNTGRKRLNLLGTLNIDNKQTVVIEKETIDSEAIISLLEGVAQKQKQGKIHIVMDNAKYHHSRMVKSWLLHHPRVKLIFLPPYSPNLNIIERLWRFFHIKITNNHYFETFTEFKDATSTFFHNLKDYQTELDSLLTENFQTLPLVANLS
ncbi:IS630 family transposase [Candidatus Roizmanbacteria bacterium CG_4_10_14_0_8_um_filter_33_9]|uniref:IS630 family transposase n=1 Tax=Candidatus Roizmanbacteria bacterium CG_4_10_14_0_8_um_filter_33_9 TaxID=1974826 RepID=A0A2M7QHC8_9BACT|nr:MAG: IS630 family transposase [Candidatus Roizmanbacteria bacterium CG_4_10_14_0_8_um_filter_33_9]